MCTTLYSILFFWVVFTQQCRIGDIPPLPGLNCTGLYWTADNIFVTENVIIPNEALNISTLTVGPGSQFSLNNSTLLYEYINVSSTSVFSLSDSLVSGVTFDQSGNVSISITNIQQQKETIETLLWSLGAGAAVFVHIFADSAPSQFSIPLLDFCSNVVDQDSKLVGTLTGKCYEGYSFTWPTTQNSDQYGCSTLNVAVSASACGSTIETWIIVVIVVSICVVIVGITIAGYTKRKITQRKILHDLRAKAAGY